MTQPPERELSPLSSGDLPSSFDEDADFFNEGRTAKLFRKLRQEPLIPLGCVATSYALYMATKSIRQGDHHQTNRMFRARIYAQGFTLIAIVAGSIFFQDERLKRRSLEKKEEEKKSLEKRERWLRELELRDEEDKKWRERIESAKRGVEMTGENLVGDVKTLGKVAKDRAQSAQERGLEVMKSAEVKAKSAAEKVKDAFPSKSVREAVILDGWGPGKWQLRFSEAWRRS